MLFRSLALMSLSLFISCSGRKYTGGSPGRPGAYVIVVSLDGFKWDYQDLYETPNLDLLEKDGVKARYLIPSFPTKTFPNHYTLATGLYPDHHGIINNSFYASDLGGIYRIGDREMVANPEAYFGEPIWVTAERQGVRTASYFWVGSEAEIQGIGPSYWFPYEQDVPYLTRVDQVIEWLEMPKSSRPGLLLLYFDQPDGIAHRHGPEHHETGEMVRHLDSILGCLREGIAALEYGEQVNLIVLSDHGMGPITKEKYVNFTEHLEEHWTTSIVGGNPVYLVQPAEGFADSVIMALEGIEGLSAWLKEDIPARLHYGASPRFPGIVVVADSLWSIGTGPDLSEYSRGAHGYDNAFMDMNAIFYAEGPAFKEGYSAAPFSNVEVYGIISTILDLVPAPTDGNVAHVRHMFREE